MLTLRGLTFDAAAPRIIVPLFARSLGALRPLAAAADADPAAEVVELRLDPLPEVDFSAALALVRSLTDQAADRDDPHESRGRGAGPDARHLRRPLPRTAGPGRRGRTGH